MTGYCVQLEPSVWYMQESCKSSLCNCVSGSASSRVNCSPQIWQHWSSAWGFIYHRNSSLKAAMLGNGMINHFNDSLQWTVRTGHGLEGRYNKGNWTEINKHPTRQEISPESSHYIISGRSWMCRLKMLAKSSQVEDLPVTLILYSQDEGWNK